MWIAIFLNLLMAALSFRTVNRYRKKLGALKAAHEDATKLVEYLSEKTLALEETKPDPSIREDLDKLANLAVEGKSKILAAQKAARDDGYRQAIRDVLNNRGDVARLVRNTLKGNQ